MTLNLHYKYAIMVGTRWVSKNDEDKYYLSSDEKDAEARWDMRGALAIKDRYVYATWNKTMGDKPIMEVKKIHRPQRIHHWW
jgi:hypothetical protein